MIHQKNQRSFFKIFYQMVFAGAACGLTIVTIGYPFDTFKTLMQTGKNVSFWDCLMSRIRTHGIFSLYRGSLFPYITIASKRAIQYDLWERTQTRTTSIKGRLSAAIGSILSGGIIGGFGTFFSCPMQNIKILMQSSSVGENKIYSNSVHCMKLTYQERGFFHGFYRGFHVNFTKDFCYAATFLGCYGFLRKNYVKKNSKCEYFLMGGISSTIATIITFPIDTLKANVQSNKIKGSLFYTARSLVSTRGVFGLWRGVTPAILRIFPNAASSIAVYEHVRKWENKYLSRK